jgi:hypothetical protein
MVEIADLTEPEKVLTARFTELRSRYRFRQFRQKATGSDRSSIGYRFAVILAKTHVYDKKTGGEKALGVGFRYGQAAFGQRVVIATSHRLPTLRKRRAESGPPSMSECTACDYT